uniref:Uncharacterized protein n=1 Tax=Anguilla anguilla TaxID=7936 RepID=A0A0E9XTR5_ANGAN
MVPRDVIPPGKLLIPAPGSCVKCSTMSQHFPFKI